MAITHSCGIRQMAPGGDGHKTRAAHSTDRAADDVRADARFQCVGGILPHYTGAFSDADTDTGEEI